MQTPRKAKRILKKYERFQQNGDVTLLYSSFSELDEELRRYVGIKEAANTNLDTRIILKGWIDPQFRSKLALSLAFKKLMGANLSFQFGFLRDDVATALGRPYLNSGFKIELSSNTAAKFHISRSFLGVNFQLNPSSSNTRYLIEEWIPSSANELKAMPGVQLAPITVDSLFRVEVERNYLNRLRRIFGLPPKLMPVDAVMLNNTELLIGALRSFHNPEFAQFIEDAIPIEYKQKIRFLSEVHEIGTEIEGSVVLQVQRIYENDSAKDPRTVEKFPKIVFKGNIGKAAPGPISIQADLVKITDVSDVNIQKGGTIISNDKLLVVDRAADPRIEFVSGQWDHIFSSALNGDRALVGLCEPDTKTYENGILLSGRNDFNWYHWMIEYLPRALEVDHMFDSEIPWVVSNRVPSSGLEALNMISKREILVCDSEKLCHFDNLKVLSPNSSVIDTLLAPWEKISRFNLANLRALREKLLIDSSDSRFSKRVFIERKSTHRNVVNQDELMEVAVNQGFDPVSIDDLSFGDQLNLFSNSESIITAGGAVMANFILMKPNSKLIQLNTSANKDFIIPSLLCTISGTNFTSVVGRPVVEKGTKQSLIDQIHNSYKINPRDLVLALN
jgi:hypothetical protein